MGLCVNAQFKGSNSIKLTRLCGLTLTFCPPIDRQEDVRGRRYPYKHRGHTLTHTHTLRLMTESITCIQCFFLHNSTSIHSGHLATRSAVSLCASSKPRPSAFQLASRRSRRVSSVTRTLLCVGAPSGQFLRLEAFGVEDKILKESR